eukprot:483120-Heterocapsa_arctica.AAC.1
MNIGMHTSGLLERNASSIGKPILTAIKVVPGVQVVDQLLHHLNLPLISIAWSFKRGVDRHASLPNVVQRACELGERLHVLHPPILRALPDLVRQVRIDASPRAPG